MRRSRSANWTSYLLILGGAFLLYLGARDFLGSQLGQQDAAEAFAESPVPVRTHPVNTASNNPLSPGETIGKLVIPRLDSELYVVEGDGPRELRRGPGHLTGTALPGDAGNCVIAGHRDTHFRVLKDIRVGDDLFLQTHNGLYVYRVQRTSIVKPTDTAALQPTPDARLNLITCYPFYYVGSAPKRFVVEAKLTGTTAPAS